MCSVDQRITGDLMRNTESQAPSESDLLSDTLHFGLLGELCISLWVDGKVLKGQ